MYSSVDSYENSHGWRLHIEICQHLNASQVQIQIQIQKGLLKHIHMYSNHTQWQYQDVYKH